MVELPDEIWLKIVENLFESDKCFSSIKKLPLVSRQLYHVVLSNEFLKRFLEEHFGLDNVKFYETFQWFYYQSLKIDACVASFCGFHKILPSLLKESDINQKHYCLHLALLNDRPKTFSYLLSKVEKLPTMCSSTLKNLIKGNKSDCLSILLNQTVIQLDHLHVDFFFDAPDNIFYQFFNKTNQFKLLNFISIYCSLKNVPKIAHVNDLKVRERTNYLLNLFKSDNGMFSDIINLMNKRQPNQFSVLLFQCLFNFVNFKQLSENLYEIQYFLLLAKEFSLFVQYIKSTKKYIRTNALVQLINNGQLTYCLAQIDYQCIHVIDALNILIKDPPVILQIHECLCKYSNDQDVGSTPQSIQPLDYFINQDRNIFKIWCTPHLLCCFVKHPRFLIDIVTNEEQLLTKLDIIHSVLILFKQSYPLFLCLLRKMGQDNESKRLDASIKYICSKIY